MVETKKILTVLTLFIFFPFKISLANIYQVTCKTNENNNSIRSFTVVYSFNRGSIVINKLNNQKTKYKINITRIHNKDGMIFDAKDMFYTLNFSPEFSYIRKNDFKTNEAPKYKLINDELSEITAKCSKEKIVKKEPENISTDLENKQIKLDEKNIEKILDQLKQNKNIQNQDLNKLIQNLNTSNNKTKINPEQLKGLLQSQSVIGKLTSKDTLNKLKSEEFLKMIKEEIQKMINK